MTYYTITIDPHGRFCGPIFSYVFSKRSSLGMIGKWTEVSRRYVSSSSMGKTELQELMDMIPEDGKFISWGKGSILGELVTDKLRD